MLLVNQSAMSGLKNPKVVILTWETKNVQYNITGRGGAQKNYELLKPGKALIVNIADNKWSI